MNLNKAFVLGNVTRDPEVRMMPSGQQVCNFGIATNRFYTTQQGEKKQDAEFHNIVCFGKLADISSRYLKKGSLILIEGRIQTRNWTNAQGAKQYRTEIVAETLQLGPRGGTGTGGGMGQDYNKDSEKETSAQDSIPVIEENYMPPADTSVESKQDEIDIKDIPF